MREDGRLASFPIERIGRVFAPIFSIQPDKIDEAFDEIHERGRQLAMPEPRLRDAQTGEADSIKLINDLIDSLLPSELTQAVRAANSKTLWSLQAEAAVPTPGRVRYDRRLPSNGYSPSPVAGGSRPRPQE